MYRMQASLVAALAVVAAAVPTDVIDRSLTARATADFYNMIDLDQFEVNSSIGTLDKRIDWRWCVHSQTNFATCTNAFFGVANVVTAIANAAKANSDSKDCSYHEGEVDDLQYQIHATGSNCDTTATEETIAGGLKTYFDAHGGSVCDVHCVQQTHGGTYTGYLLIAPKGEDISKVKCDSSVRFPTADCGSGGQKDAP